VAGKENVSGHTRMNFIYRLDAARMLTWIIEKELWNETFNGVAPVHSLRMDVYEQNAVDLGLETPKSYESETTGNDRIVSAEKILKTEFEFDYPNPLDFPYKRGLM